MDPLFIALAAALAASVAIHVRLGLAHASACMLVAAITLLILHEVGAGRDAMTPSSLAFYVALPLLTGGLGALFLPPSWSDDPGPAA